MIAVIGAGPAGLSAAYRLSERGTELAVFEKAREAGGLCRSYRKRGHTFDLGGHFLHIRSKEAHKFLKNLMPDGLVHHKRCAAIMIEGVRVPYPFQAHLGYLSREEAADCLAGYIHALAAKRGAHEKTFGRWLKACFGEGMYRKFFKPYNEKFWKCDLDEILPDWADWSVPRPKVEETVRGALGLENKGMGYNPEFFYPKEGGVASLITALVQRIADGLVVETEVKEITAKERKFVLAGGQEVGYESLVNTAPLPKLFAMIKDAPAALKRGAQRLEWLAVDCVQLGFRRQSVIEENWIYIPENKYPFFRVGKYPGSEGDSGTALFVEFSRLHDNPVPDKNELLEVALQGLLDLGIVNKREKPDVAEMVTLDPAYVIYDKHRRWFLPRAQVYLDRMGIYSIGRYGAWEYSSIEGALMAGKRVAEELT